MSKHHRSAPSLRLGVAALSALLWAAQPAQAQSADPIAGRALFNNTIATSGINTLTGDCTSCHASVQERRTKIGGSPYAEISLTTAGNRLGMAIATVAEMRQFQAMTQKQVEDLAAYIADTPETSTDQLNFTATTLNTPTADQFVELRHARAATATLQVLSVTITGSAQARFRRTADTCEAQTLQPAGTCRVNVVYTAPDTAGAIVPMTFTLREAGATTTFTRTMYLNGATATTSPPAGGGGGATADDGGGALGEGWLGGLALATLLLYGSSRRPVRASARGRG